MRNRVFSLFAILVLFSCFLTGQVQNTGTFIGTVSEEGRDQIPGATVSVKNLETGFIQETVTNEQGRYRIERLPRGPYSIAVSIAGFQTLIKEGIVLMSGAELKINFELKVGLIEQQVIVFGKAPLVETTRAQVSTLITSKEMMSYPQSNRSFLSLMQYAPGSAYYTISSGGPAMFSVNGQRGTSNNFMVDGIDNNDTQFGGEQISTLPPEAIQEFRLISNNFSAEYGRNSGGILNVAMKSGTNELHGSGWIFHQGDSAVFKSADWLTHDRPTHQRYQFGGTLGGPIIPDKTFFYFTAEGLIQNTTQQQPLFFITREAMGRARGSAKQFFDQYGSQYPVPTYDFIDLDGDGLSDIGRSIYNARSNYQGYTLGLKIDHVFSAQDRINFRWIYNNFKTKYDMPQVPGKQMVSPNTYHSGGMTWLHLFGSTMFNELRLGFHRDFYDDNGTLDFPNIEFLDGTIGINGYAENNDTTNTTFQLADILSFQKGNHSFKIGGELRYLTHKSNYDPYTKGSYWYFNATDWLSDQGAYMLIVGANPPDPSPKFPYVPGDPYQPWDPLNTVRKYRNIEGGLFLQDDWRVADRLTISAGLRWEYFGVPKEYSGAGIAMPAFGTAEGYASGQVIEGTYNEEGIRYLMFDGREILGKGLWNNYYKAFAPKVSFAYDLTGDGKTSLRGGAGISYDRFHNQAYTNDRLNYPDFNFVTLFGEAYGLPAIHPTIPFQLPMENISGLTYSLRWFVPNLKPQKSYNVLLGIQREIASDTSVEIDYMGSFGRNLGEMHRPNRFTGDGVDGTRDLINPYVSPNDANIRSNSSKSNYHGLQVILTKRFTGGWSWYTSYTFSKGKDLMSWYLERPAYSHEKRDLDWGRTDYDVRHRVVGGFVWDIPWFKNSRSSLIKNIIAGWQLSGSFHYTGGIPYTIETQRYDYNMDYVRWDRPLWLGKNYGDAIGWNNGTPYVDPSLFGVPNPPSAAHDLNYYNQNLLKRNTFNWFPTHNIDIGLQKYFLVPMAGRDVTIQLIAEVFNLLKTTSWDLPPLLLEDVGFGISPRQSGVRQSQLSLRIMF